MPTLPAPAPELVDSRQTWLRLAMIRLQDAIHACVNAGVDPESLYETLSDLQTELEKS